MYSKNYKIKNNKTRKNKVIKPSETHYINVSNIHKIAYYIYGNKKKKPLCYIHGGPGGKITNDFTKIVDFNKFFVVAIDQRGCGKSTPQGELKENTTKHLIEDMEVVRKKCNIKKWSLWGGSWGSLVALYYAINYHQYVKSILLRGVFLGTKEEIDIVENGDLIKYIYPDVWEKYIKNIPNKNTTDVFKEYEKILLNSKGEKLKKAQYDYAFFQEGLLRLKPLSDKEKHKEVMKDKSYFTLSNIAPYYFKHGCFLNDKNYFLNDKNINKIKKIPIHIVQGIYDMTTPAYSAYYLHKKLPRSKLYNVVAGHSSNDSELIKKTNQVLNNKI